MDVHTKLVRHQGPHEVKYLGYKSKTCHILVDTDQKHKMLAPADS